METQSYINNAMPPPLVDKPDPDPEKENIRRREKVKEGFKHSWEGYKKYAWGYDELQPLSRKGKSWVKGHPMGFGLTILDSLTPLYLMGFEKEFEEALEWVRTSLDFDKDGDMSPFETTIRIIGSLVSTFELSGERHKFLIDKAVDLGHRLLYAYNTTTGIPHATVNLLTHTHSNPKWTAGSSVLSEFGTVQLEFLALSFHSGRPEFGQAAVRIMNVVRRHLPPDGLPPTYFNAVTGKWTSDHITWGALGDSYYEYLLKQYIYSAKTEPRYRDMFIVAANSAVDRLIQRSKPSRQVYLAESKRGAVVHKMDHLTCFAGGLFGLASKEIGGDHAHEWLKIGMDLGESCHRMYAQTKTKLSPEVGEWRGGNDLPPEVSTRASYNILRPEAAEAWWYLWRLTREQRFRDYAWEAFLAFTQWCRVDSGGFAGLKNVNMMPPIKDDTMQSFWLAETLLYLWLIFAEDDALDLSQWVLNTEAHPLKIRPEVSGERWYKTPKSPSEVEGYVLDPKREGYSGQENVVEKPVPPGYKVLRRTDAPEADLPLGDGNPVTGRDVMKMAQQCNKVPACMGFNSNGYLKSQVRKTAHESGCDLYIKQT